jgi:TATA-box binding protein (TBP) (component of TFIID and TFIIIB)
VLLSSNGKLVCTGTTTIAQAEAHLKSVTKQLQTSIDPSITMQPIVQQNILASTDLQTPLALDTIAQLLSNENIVYQPEINPWLRYQLSDDLVVLLFPSGRLVFIGNGELSTIEDAFELLKNKLSSIGVL